MSELEKLEQQEKPAKRRKRSNFGQELAAPGETGAFVRYAMVAWDLPPIDISNIDQVELRAKEYFKHCIETDSIPNKATLSNWLGINRSTLNSWERGEYRTATHQAFAQRVDSMMEGVLVELLLNNGVNPANGIFLLKNHSGYRDQIDIAPAVPQPLGDLPDPEALRRRIEAHVVDE